MTTHTRDVFAIIKYSSQILVSLFVLGFSMYMIISDSDTSNVFVPIITWIVGCWLPQPKLKRKSTDSGSSATTIETL